MSKLQEPWAIKLKVSSLTSEVRGSSPMAVYYELLFSPIGLVWETCHGALFVDFLPGFE